MTHFLGDSQPTEEKAVSRNMLAANLPFLSFCFQPELSSFSASYIIASTCSRFFLFRCLVFTPFCSHHSPPCPVLAQLPNNASAAGECPNNSAHAESICTRPLPAGMGTAQSHHGPHYTFACRGKPKVLQNRDHYKSLSASEGSMRSICTISAPGCSPYTIWP